MRASIVLYVLRLALETGSVLCASGKRWTRAKSLRLFSALLNGATARYSKRRNSWAEKCR